MYFSVYRIDRRPEGFPVFYPRCYHVQILLAYWLLASGHCSRASEGCRNVHLLSFVEEVLPPTVVLALLLRHGEACPSCPSAETHAPQTPCASTYLSCFPYRRRPRSNGIRALDIVANASCGVRPPPSLNSLLILFRPKSGRFNASPSPR
jgi:hypothetical protein